MFLRCFCTGMMACFTVVQALGQFTSLNADGTVATLYINAYGNRDNIFVFNQTPQPKMGDLSLRFSESSELPESESEPDLFTFKWYRFDYDIQNFEEQPFYTDDDIETSQTGFTGRL